MLVFLTFVVDCLRWKLSAMPTWLPVGCRCGTGINTQGRYAQWHWIYSASSRLFTSHTNQTNTCSSELVYTQVGIRQNYSPFCNHILPQLGVRIGCYLRLHLLPICRHIFGNLHYSQHRDTNSLRQRAFSCITYTRAKVRLGG